MGSELGVHAQERIIFSAGDRQQEEMEDFTDGLWLDGPCGPGGAASLCAPQFGPAVQVVSPALRVSITISQSPSASAFQLVR
jgi:hypothetical protein